ncbi:KCNJ11 [Symbiodinium sp. CCMP2592]|nr:KCNJ11 [Symbiodinium sp. CCMP2592]
MCRLAAKRVMTGLALLFLSQRRSCKELRLPPLDPEQRKQAGAAPRTTPGETPARQAKKLAEKYPEIKCESYGFGEERASTARRRLHLFKSSAALKTGLAKEGSREVPRTESASDQSTAVSGATSPDSAEDASGGVFEDVAALPSNLYQVRNTFIHIEEQGVADQRNIQSMPHGMFRQRLQEEATQSAPGRATGPVPESTSVTPSIPEVPEVTKDFAPGTEVVIEGLQKFPAFNGLRGTVQLLDKTTGRYNVQLSSADGPLEQIAKIRGDNLRMLVPPPPPFESSVTVKVETPSAMHARAPDFVPMRQMGLTNIPPNWQDPHAVPPLYTGDPHCQYDPYVHPAHVYPPPVPPPVKYAAR